LSWWFATNLTEPSWETTTARHSAYSRQRRYATMASFGALHGLKDTMLRLDIEGAINHFVFKAGDLNFNAKSQYGEFVIEQKATV